MSKDSVRNVENLIKGNYVSLNEQIRYDKSKNHSTGSGIKVFCANGRI